MPQGERRLGEGEPLFEALQDRRSMAFAALRRAIIAADRSDYDGAAAAAERAQALASEVGFSGSSRSHPSCWRA